MPCFSPIDESSKEYYRIITEMRKEKMIKETEHYHRLLQDTDVDTERNYIEAIDSWHMVNIPASREDCTPRAVLSWLDNNISGRYLWNTLHEVTFAIRDAKDPWWDKKMNPSSRCRILRFELEEDSVMFKMVWG